MKEWLVTYKNTHSVTIQERIKADSFTITNNEGVLFYRSGEIIYYIAGGYNSKLISIVLDETENKE